MSAQSLRSPHEEGTLDTQRVPSEYLVQAEQMRRITWGSTREVYHDSYFFYL